ncbi:MAG: hypothetical protein ACRC7V_01485 [Lachnospiraceae bacterium]
MILFTILFLMILPLGHDLQFQFYRIGAMAEELLRTEYKIPIRILSDSFNGYGYGVSLFYGDTLLYPAAMLLNLGVDIKTSYKLLVVFIFWLVFLSMFYNMKRITKDHKFAIYTAYIYTFSSYFLIDLCIRAAIGESSAFIFLPFVASAMYGMICAPRKYDFLHLTVGMTGLILSHNITTLFVGGILAVVVLVHFKTLWKNGGIKNVILAAVLTVGLTATYLVPMLEAYSVQSYQTPTNNEYQMQEFVKNTMEWQDFFFPYEIKKGISKVFDLGWKVETWQPGGVGLFFLLTLFLEIKTRKKKKNRLLQVGFWISFLLYITMFIEPLVTIASYFLSFIQFGWRLLTFLTFGVVLYMSYLSYTYLSQKQLKKCLMLTIAIACFTIGGRFGYQVYLNEKGMDYIKEINPQYYQNYILEYNKNDADNLYLPSGTDYYLFETRGERIDVNNKEVSVDFERNGGTIQIAITGNSHEDTTLELPLYYYKGYAAVNAETKEEFAVTKSENNLVEVFIGNKNDMEIVVSYKGTRIQKISDWISLLTICSLGIVLCAFVMKKVKYWKSGE